jgi:hypothetical protein
VRRLSRPVLILLILAGVVLFVAISTILARVFSVDGAERAAVISLIQAEARGDQAGMIRQLYQCDSACRSRVAYDATHYREAGKVETAEISPSAGFAFVSTIGTTRVAWFATDPKPVVQCFRVRRQGNALTGFSIRVLTISIRIPSSHYCPKRY